MRAIPLSGSLSAFDIIGPDTLSSSQPSLRYAQDRFVICGRDKARLQFCRKHFDVIRGNSARQQRRPTAQSSVVIGNPADCFQPKFF